MSPYGDTVEVELHVAWHWCCDDDGGSGSERRNITQPANIDCHTRGFTHLLASSFQNTRLCRKDGRSVDQAVTSPSDPSRNGSVSPHSSGGRGAPGGSQRGRDVMFSRHGSDACLSGSSCQCIVLGSTLLPRPPDPLRLLRGEPVSAGSEVGGSAGEGGHHSGCQLRVTGRRQGSNALGHSCQEVQIELQRKPNLTMPFQL